MMIRFAPTNKEFILEKFFSFPIAFAFILLLSPENVGVAYLILGHAHFMLTALYQYKMGKITPRSFLVYLGLFALLFYIAHLFPRAFTLFVATALLFHVYYGEARHIKRAFMPTYLCLTLGIVAMLSSWLAIELWSLPISMPAVIGISLGFAALACFFHLRRTVAGDVEMLFLTLFVLLGIFISLELLGMRPRSLESFGFVVIAHYFTTYFNVFRSFTRKGQGKQWVFVWESIGMNLLFLSGFLLVFYKIGMDNALFYYVYQPISFYVWTLMHFITTMDFHKYRESLRGFLAKRTNQVAS